jgi:hypothetical protein
VFIGTHFPSIPMNKCGSNNTICMKNNKEYGSKHIFKNKARERNKNKMYNFEQYDSIFPSEASIILLLFIHIIR